PEYGSTSNSPDFFNESIDGSGRAETGEPAQCRSPLLYNSSSVFSSSIIFIVTVSNLPASASQESLFFFKTTLSLCFHESNVNGPFVTYLSPAFCAHFPLSSATLWFTG